ncbi:MAG: NAD(P)/FAD-dependent oxidoreductase [Candidatus Doudnabacteria bacterium]|nr:NAD(P)/FAD-dependent oxidoreductase [Candidatus Doudnabacteria bacterium]
MPNQKQTLKEKKHIVILGGGFAGVRAALDLGEYFKRDDAYEIILIDKKDYHLYHAALYEAATAQHGLVEASQVKRAVVIPFGSILKRSKVKHFKAFIDHVDLDDGKVVTDSRIVYFDYLVTAMGSVSDYYGIQGMDKYAFTLKSLDDAIMIRNRIEELVSKKDKGDIVIGGGGFAGVEFAGEVYNLLKHECEYHKKDLAKFSVTILEGSSNYLPGLSEKVSKLAAERLAKQNVQGKFSSIITEVGSNYVVLNEKDRIDFDLLIWTGGVRSCVLPFSEKLEQDKKGRTVVNEFLNIRKYPNVFIVGDNVCFIDKLTKSPAPQTAQEAIRQGRLAAKNIYRLVRGKELLPYHAGPSRYVIPVSGKYAIMYTKNLIIAGFFGWMIRRFVDLRYFVSVLTFIKALKLWLSETSVFMKND